MSDQVEGLRFPPAFWKVFEAKLIELETNHPLVLQNPGIYAHQFAGRLIDIEGFIIDYLRESTAGKASFLDEISACDEIATLSDVLSTNQAVLGDPRRGRSKFLDLIGKHIGAVRRFARDAGIGAQVSDDKGARLRLRYASPEIFLVPWILRRLSYEREENVIEVAIGPTGSGKSYSAIWTAMRIAAAMNVPFELTHIVFTIQEVIQLVHHLDPPLPRGSVIIFDDAGVGANARDWRAQINVILAKMAQGILRDRGIFLIVTVPDLSFIDVQVRKNIHLKLVGTVNERGENQKGTFLVQVGLQDEEGVISFGPPKLTAEDFGTSTPFSIDPTNIDLESFHFPIPPEEITGPYKEKKRKFLSMQITQLEEEMVLDEKLENVRRQALYDKYSRMIEDQGDWDEISDLRKQGARLKAEAEIEKAAMRKKKLTEGDEIDQLVIERVNAGESEEMIAEVVSSRMKRISGPAIHKRIVSLRERGLL